MYTIKVPRIINLIIGSFYRLGLWHRENETTISATLMKLFYSIYHLLFPLSLFVNGSNITNKDESIFLIEMGFVFAVLSLKLLYIIWGKAEILQLVDRIGVYSLADSGQFTLADDTLKSFNKITKLFICIIYVTNILATLIVPFVGSKKKLFFDIAFPLDHKNDEFAFWLAFVFLSSEIFVSVIAFLFSAFTWYLMISCSLRYEILGLQIRNMGVRKTANLTKAEKEDLYLQDLITAVKSYKSIKGYQCYNNEK